MAQYHPTSPASTAVADTSIPARQRPNHSHTDSHFVNGAASDGHGYSGANRWVNGEGHVHHEGWGAYDEKHGAKSWPASSTAPNGVGWTGDEQRWRTFSSFLSLSHLKRYVPYLSNDLSSPRTTISAPFVNISPSMVQFCLLCSLWYSSSALSSNTGKAILTQFRYPITLTFIQFGFVAFYCLLFGSPLIRFTRLRKPTKEILKSTFPMGLFQVGGHMFSSMAISRIPVSTVHTIKALSPLFTVAAYAMLFGVRYSSQTYISLLPLTIGVMLACSFDMSASNMLGLLCAFGSAIVFVSSNIIFKKIMPSSSGGITSHKLDKLNLLLYSSSTAFVLMIPMWLYYDLPALLAPSDYVAHPSHGHASPHSVLYYFFLNGTVHFAQNIIAFIILSSTSPVTYSIASLIKRVVVICIAIVWFNQSVHPIQGFGICMTFVGLWMYNSAKTSVEKGENKMRRVEAARDLVLPSTKAELAPSPIISPLRQVSDTMDVVPVAISSLHGRPIYNRTATGQLTGLIQPSGPPPTHIHVPQRRRFSHSHAHPNAPQLKIATPPFEQPPKSHLVTSPTDSYPSPPPSRDSPPTTASFTHSFQHPQDTLAINHRRGTVSHVEAGQEKDNIGFNMMLEQATPLYATA